MKRRINFNEMMISEKLRKENPSEDCGASLIKLMNSLYKRRLMILAFVLGNLWMVSTGYGFDIAINNSSTDAKNGSWSGEKTGPYVFTPTNNEANIRISDITNRLDGGASYRSNTVTINTNGTGNVTISSAIASTNTTTTLTINAGGSILSTVGITAGNIVLNGTTGISISADLMASGTITINDGATVVTTGTEGANNGQTAGIISGGNFIKLGAGTFKLSGANTYTGTTTISEGILEASSIVVSGSASNLGNATSAIVLGSATTKGTLSYTGTTPIAFTRGFTVNAGGGEISGSLSSLSGAIALNGPLTLLNTGNTAISGVLSSSGALTINNAGKTITLSGENTYTGATSITAGTLKLNHAAALGTSSEVTVASGTTLELNGFSTAVPLSLSGTLSNSPGTSTAVNYSGAITLGDASSIAATSNITLGGGINGNFLLTKTGTGTLNTGTILSEISALTISAGNLTIPAGGKVTVAGATAITPPEGLTILSDVSSTGSLITASASGTAKVERYMAPTKWHIVSSPVTELTVNQFLSDNLSIPTNKNLGYESQKGMSEYSPAEKGWMDYFDTDEPDNGDITPGKGYSMRVKTGETKVSFIGKLNASVPTLTNLIADSWNCIGNPYTSAIRINAADGIANFLDDNSSSFDPLFGAIYLWYQEKAEVNNLTVGIYESISNVPQLDVVPPGQAFMVRMKEGVQSISFTHAMQVHHTTVALKSTNNIWPTIKLTAMADSITSSTIIAFHEGMTPGLDPTYDAGLLKGGASVEVYTQLLEDNGIPFDIQALPADYQSTVVPVGLDCTKGQQVSFSAELMHLPSSCQAILEDRLNNTFTDLSLNSYMADLMGSTVSQGRFFLHTSYATTGIDSRNRIQNLRAWAVSSQEMKISGQVSSKAIATLYDLQGRTVAMHPLQAGKLNSVPLKGLKQGVYLLRVQDASRSQVLKVTVGKD